MEKPKLNANNFKTYLGVVISCAFLWLTFSKSHIEWAQLKPDGNATLFFCLAIAVFMVSIVVQAQRMKLLWLGNGRTFTSIHAYSSLMIGNFYNCTLPGNIGEGVRAWHFHKKNNIPFSASLAGMMLEKWMDAQLLLLFIGGLFLFPYSHSWNVVYTAFLIMGAIILTVNIGFVLVLLNKRLLKYLIRLLPTYKLRAFTYITFLNFKHLLFKMYKTKRLPVFMLGGIVLVFHNILQYFLILKATHIGYPVNSFYTVYLLGCIMFVIAVIPSAPSGVGVAHYSIYMALITAAGILGVTVSAHLNQMFAVAAIYLHLSCLLPQVIPGVVFLIKEKNTLFNGS